MLHGFRLYHLFFIQFLNIALTHLIVRRSYKLKNFTSKICCLIAAWEIEEKLCIIRGYKISSIHLFPESVCDLNFVEFIESKTRFQAIRWQLQTRPHNYFILCLPNLMWICTSLGCTELFTPRSLLGNIPFQQDAYLTLPPYVLQ